MSADADALRTALQRMHRKPYGFYKDLRDGTWDVDGFTLNLDHVQGDPFAAPSRVRIEVPHDAARLAGFAHGGAHARRATADFLQRGLLRVLTRSGARGEGSGKSGLLEVAPVGPEVLERSGVVVNADGDVRLRLSAGLPASGRRILGDAAVALLLERLPDAVATLFADLDEAALRAHVFAVEDQVALRSALEPGGLIAFLADGAILPRRSGVDPRPLPDAIALEAPDTLRVTLPALHAGRVSGLGIPRGVTLITGGGYHGKSTLLQALALCVYDHAPGDGREACVSDARAVSVRAEDGRATRGVDLRPFIGDLPAVRDPKSGRATDRFDTDDASGSTSQAAAIVEALEVGARTLLIDEDTAATNFMIRDARMRRLVPAEYEPITPFLDRVRQLHEERGVSSVLVVGGAGDYLDVADTVLRMDAYRPREVTQQARDVAAALPLGEAAPQAPGPWHEAAARVPDPRSLDASRGRRPERVRSVKTRAIEFGREEIDVSLLYQLIDPAQCRAIGDALLVLSRGLCDGERSIAELCDALETQMQDEGLEAIVDQGFGDRARPRRHEIAAALNRLRALRLIHFPDRNA